MQARLTSAHWFLFRWTPNPIWNADGVHVQFLDLEDLEADPEGNSVQGENSDEIIFHRSQAEAGITFVDIDSLFLLLLFFQFNMFAGNADSQAWLGTQLYWGAMGLERNQVEAVVCDAFSLFAPFTSKLNPGTLARSCSCSKPPRWTLQHGRNARIWPWGRSSGQRTCPPIL